MQPKKQTNASKAAKKAKNSKNSKASRRLTSLSKLSAKTPENNEHSEINQDNASTLTAAVPIENTNAPLSNPTAKQTKRESDQRNSSPDNPFYQYDSLRAAEEWFAYMRSYEIPNIHQSLGAFQLPMYNRFSVLTLDDPLDFHLRQGFYNNYLQQGFSNNQGTTFNPTHDLAPIIPVYQTRTAATVPVGNNKEKVCKTKVPGGKTAQPTSTAVQKDEVVAISDAAVLGNEESVKIDDATPSGIAAEHSNGAIRVPPGFKPIVPSQEVREKPKILGPLLDDTILAGIERFERKYERALQSSGHAFQPYRTSYDDNSFNYGYTCRIPMGFIYSKQPNTLHTNPLCGQYAPHETFNSDCFECLHFLPHRSISTGMINSVSSSMCSLLTAHSEPVFVDFHKTAIAETFDKERRVLLESAYRSQSHNITTVPEIVAAIVAKQEQQQIDNEKQSSNSSGTNTTIADALEHRLIKAVNAIGVDILAECHKHFQTLTERCNHMDQAIYEIHNTLDVIKNQRLGLANTDSGIHEPCTPMTNVSSTYEEKNIEDVLIVEHVEENANVPLIYMTKVHEPVTPLCVALIEAHAQTAVIDDPIQSNIANENPVAQEALEPELDVLAAAEPSDDKRPVKATVFDAITSFLFVGIWSRIKAFFRLCFTFLFMVTTMPFIIAFSLIKFMVFKLFNCICALVSNRYYGITTGLQYFLPRSSQGYIFGRAEITFFSPLIAIILVLQFIYSYYIYVEYDARAGRYSENEVVRHIRKTRPITVLDNDLVRSEAYIFVVLRILLLVNLYNLVYYFIVRFVTRNYGPVYNLTNQTQIFNFLHPLTLLNNYNYYIYGYYLFFNNNARNDHQFLRNSILDTKRRTTMTTGFCKKCYVYGHTEEQHAGCNAICIEEADISYNYTNNVIIFADAKNVKSVSAPLTNLVHELTFDDVKSFHKNPQNYYSETQRNNKNVIVTHVLPTMVAVYNDVDFSKRSIYQCPAFPYNLYINEDVDTPHYLVASCKDSEILEFLTKLHRIGFTNVTTYGFTYQIPKFLQYLAVVKDFTAPQNKSDPELYTIAYDTLTQQFKTNKKTEDETTNDEYSRPSTADSEIQHGGAIRKAYNGFRNFVRSSTSLSSNDNYKKHQRGNRGGLRGIVPNSLVLNFPDNTEVSEYGVDIIKYNPYYGYFGRYSMKLETVQNPLVYLGYAIFFFLASLFSSLWYCISYIQGNRVCRLILFIIALFSLIQCSNGAEYVPNICRNNVKIRCNGTYRYMQSYAYDHGFYFDKNGDDGEYYVGNADSFVYNNQKLHKLSELANLHQNQFNLRYTAGSCKKNSKICDYSRFAGKSICIRKDSLHLFEQLLARNPLVNRISSEKDCASLTHRYTINQPLDCENTPTYLYFNIDTNCAETMDFSFMTPSVISFKTFYHTQRILYHNESAPYLYTHNQYKVSFCNCDAEQLLISKITLDDNDISYIQSLVNHRAAILAYHTKLPSAQQDFILNRFGVDCAKYHLPKNCIATKEILEIKTYFNKAGFKLECIINDPECNAMGNYFNSTLEKTTVQHDHTDYLNVELPILTVETEEDLVVDYVEPVTLDATGEVDPGLLANIKAGIENKFEDYKETVEEIYEDVKAKIDVKYTGFRNSSGVKNILDHISRTYHTFDGSYTGCELYEHPDLVYLYKKCRANTLDLSKLSLHYVKFLGNTYLLEFVKEITYYTLKQSTGFTYDDGDDSFTIDYARFMYYEPPHYAIHFTVCSGDQFCMEWCHSDDYESFADGCSEPLRFASGLYYYDCFVNANNLGSSLIILILAYLTYNMSASPSVYNTAKRFLLTCGTVMLLKQPFLYTLVTVYVSESVLVFAIGYLGLVNLVNTCNNFNNIFKFKKISIVQIFEFLIAVANIPLILYFTFNVIIVALVCAGLIYYFKPQNKPWEVGFIDRETALYYWNQYVAESTTRDSLSLYNNLKRQLMYSRGIEINTEDYQRKQFLASCYSLLMQPTRPDMIIHNPAYKTFNAFYDLEAVEEGISAEGKSEIIGIKPEGCTMPAVLIPPAIRILPQQSRRILQVSYRNMNFLYAYCFESKLYIERHCFNIDNFTYLDIDWSQFKVLGKDLNMEIDTENVVHNAGFVIVPYKGYRQFPEVPQHKDPLSYTGPGFILQDNGNAYAVKIDKGRHDGNTEPGHCGFPLYALVDAKLQFLGLHVGSYTHKFTDGFWSKVFGSIPINVNFFTPLDGNVGPIKDFDVKVVIPSITRPVLDPRITGLALTAFNAGVKNRDYDSRLESVFGINKTIYKECNMNIDYDHCMNNVGIWSKRSYAYGLSFAQVILQGIAEGCDTINTLIKPESTVTSISKLVVPRDWISIFVSFLGFFVSYFYSFDVDPFKFGYINQHRYRLPFVETTFFLLVAFGLIRSLVRHQYLSGLSYIVRFIVVVWQFMRDCNYETRNEMNTLFSKFLTNVTTDQIIVGCYDHDLRPIRLEDISIDSLEYQPLLNNYFHINSTASFFVNNYISYFSVSDFYYTVYSYLIYLVHDIRFDYGCNIVAECTIDITNLEFVCEILSRIFFLIMLAFEFLIIVYTNAEFFGKIILQYYEYFFPGMQEQAIVVESSTVAKRVSTLLHMLKTLGGYEAYYDFLPKIQLLEEIRDAGTYSSEDLRAVSDVEDLIYNKLKFLSGVYEVIRDYPSALALSCVVAGVDAKTGQYDPNVTKRFSEEVQNFFAKNNETMKQIRTECAKYTPTQIMQSIFDFLDTHVKKRFIDKEEDHIVCESHTFKFLFDQFPALVEAIDDVNDTSKFIKALLFFTEEHKTDPEFTQLVYKCYNEFVEDTKNVVLDYAQNHDRKDVNRLKNDINTLQSKITKIYNVFEQHIKEQYAKDQKNDKKRSIAQSERIKREATLRNKASNLARVLYQLMLHFYNIQENARKQKEVLDDLATSLTGDRVDAPYDVEDYQNSVALQEKEDKILVEGFNVSGFSGDSFSVMPTMCGTLLRCTEDHTHGLRNCSRILADLYYKHASSNCGKCVVRYLDARHPNCGDKYDSEMTRGLSFASQQRRYYSCQKCLYCPDCIHDDCRRVLDCSSPFYHYERVVSKLQTEMFILPSKVDPTTVQVQKTSVCSATKDGEPETIPVVTAGYDGVPYVLQIPKDKSDGFRIDGFVRNSLAIFEGAASKFNYFVKRGFSSVEGLKMLINKIKDYRAEEDGIETERKRKNPQTVTLDTRPKSPISNPFAEQGSQMVVESEKAQQENTTTQTPSYPNCTRGVKTEHATSSATTSSTSNATANQIHEDTPHITLLTNHKTNNHTPTPMTKVCCVVESENQQLVLRPESMNISQLNSANSVNRYSYSNMNMIRKADI